MLQQTSDHRAPDAPRGHARDGTLPRALRYVTAIEALVLLIAGAGLFFLPGPTADAWPWELTAFNTRFLGAIYLAALLAVATMAVVGRWRPGWNTLWVVFGFTFIVLVNSLVEFERFDFRQPGTWAWFALYVTLPANAAYHLWRAWPGPPTVRAPGIWSLPLQAGAALFALYTAALVLLPETATELWPWPVDAFHARTYSAAFASLAIGFYLASRSASLLDRLAVGLTLLAFSSFSLAGLLIVDAERDVLDWTAAEPWLWVLGFGALLVLGFALIAPLRPALGPRAIDRNATLTRGFALLFGSAFIAAGITGFLPPFSSAPPASADSLEITASYGLLLGLYPVNAAHSVLHLAFGIAGIAAFAGKLPVRNYARWLAVILGALAVMGMIPGLRTTFGLLPLYGHDVWLHALEALAAAYVGFVILGPVLDEPASSYATSRTT